MKLKATCCIGPSPLANLPCKRVSKVHEATLSEYLRCMRRRRLLTSDAWYSNAKTRPLWQIFGSALGTKDGRTLQLCISLHRCTCTYQRECYAESSKVGEIGPLASSLCHRPLYIVLPCFGTPSTSSDLGFSYFDTFIFQRYTRGSTLYIPRTTLAPAAG
jgi:hypothetical protein